MTGGFILCGGFGGEEAGFVFVFAADGEEVINKDEQGGTGPSEGVAVVDVVNAPVDVHGDGQKDLAANDHSAHRAEHNHTGFAESADRVGDDLVKGLTEIEGDHGGDHGNAVADGIGVGGKDAGEGVGIEIDGRAHHRNIAKTGDKADPDALEGTADFAGADVLSHKGGGGSYR